MDWLHANIHQIYSSKLLKINIYFLINNIVFLSHIIIKNNVRKYKYCWLVGSHEFVLGALWADDLLSVSNKSLPCHGLFTQRTDETCWVPVAAFKWYKPEQQTNYNFSPSSLPSPGSPGAPLARDRFGAAGAPLGEKFCKAVRTERFVLPAGELLPSQGGLTAGADKTLLQANIRSPPEL